jgi:hypothetical protein
MAHKAARKSRQHGEMLAETTLKCRKLLENSLETNRLYWMTEMAALFSVALACGALLRWTAGRNGGLRGLTFELSGC